MNLQIDGPTLRTLCLQHGPLVSFHPYLNQGIALCKYTTREEANKAQMALNNCVLGNTTIYAESPSENEVQNILQHLPQQQQAPSATSAGSAVVNNGTGTTGGGSGSGGTSLSSGSNSSNGNGSGGNGGTNSVSNPAGSIGVPSSNASGAGGGPVGGGSASGNNNNSNGSNNMNQSTVNGATSGGNTNTKSVITNNTTGGSVGGNNMTTAMTVVGQSNSAAAATSANPTWRQTTQNQALQGPNRPAGRESDFDYISQFVCSIVDD